MDALHVHDSKLTLGLAASARLLLRIAPQLVTLGLLAFVTGWVSWYAPYNNGPAIRSDGTGYHLWTRALLDRDLSFCRWIHDPERPFSVEEQSPTFCQNKYPPGLALMRLPIMAFLVDRSDPAKLAITPEEHFASQLFGGAVLWLQAALLVWAATLLRLAPWRSCLAIVLCVFGTGLFHYATYDGSFSHAYSAFWCAVLLWAAAREHALGRPMPASILIVSSFFLFALRNTNVLLLLELCAAYVIWRAPSLTRRELIRTKLVPVAIGAGTMIVLQLAYNSYAQGRFAVSSYSGETFQWDRPMQWPVLFSYERGLFTYYPIFGLALISGFAVRSSRKLTLLLLALVLTYMTLYGFWGSWYLGGGMGHRGFVELVPLVALVLCVAWNRFRWPVLAPSIAGGLLCASVTLQIMHAYWIGEFRCDHETEENYWRQLSTFQSYLTGGTDCRPSRCEQGHCTLENASQFTFCIAGFKHAGNCVEGTCAAAVALRSVATNRYVSAQPPRRRRPQPLTVEAEKIGKPEVFLMLRVPNQPGKRRFMSRFTEAYITAPQNDQGELPLNASERSAGARETFERRGVMNRFALKAWNGRFVSSVAADGPPRLEASAESARSGEFFALERTRP
ncbi:MAG TPA: hypothetical protein VJV78_16755 [Polyangiales bacterium]|nr:hypothetical protein [Polyangiales bacterium]